MKNRKADRERKKSSELNLYYSSQQEKIHCLQEIVKLVRYIASSTCCTKSAIFGWAQYNKQCTNQLLVHVIHNSLIQASLESQQ